MPRSIYSNANWQCSPVSYNVSSTEDIPIEAISQLHHIKIKFCINKINKTDVFYIYNST